MMSQRLNLYIALLLSLSTLASIGVPSAAASPARAGVSFARAWQRVPMSGTGITSHHLGRLQVVSGGPGLIAQGIVLNGPKQKPGQHAAIWTSCVGQVWAPAPHDHGLFGTSDIFVLIVRPHDVLALANVGGRMVVWSSTDGLTWQQCPVAPYNEEGGIGVWQGALSHSRLFSSPYESAVAT